MKTLILIDGHALAFREYFALERTNMSTSDNIPTWGVYGFFKAIFDLLKKIKPDAIAVTFDVSKRTFRKEKYEEYKANREAMPDNMKIQMDLIKEGLEAFSIPVYTKEGFEADDVIGTISKQASELGHKTYILTGDQDSFQLIDKKGTVKVLIPSKGELVEYDWDKVFEKLGIYPNQVIDYKALRGDTSDNIPGIKGIGEKTAQALLSEYKNLESVLEHTKDITKPSLKSKLEEGVEIAKLSQYLATIIRDVDVKFDFEGACVEMPNINKVQEFLQKMQFFGFIKNLNKILETFNANCTKETSQAQNLQLGLFSEVLEQQNQEDFIKEDFKNDVQKLSSTLEKQKILAMNISSLENDPDIISELAFAIKENNNCKVFVLQADKNLNDNLKVLKPILENPKIEKIMQDVKHHYILLKKYGITLQGISFDTMLASYVKDPSRKHELLSQALEHLNYIITDENDICKKVYATCKLYDFWISDLDEKELKLTKEVEVPLSTVLAEMELNGITVNKNCLKRLSREFNEKLRGMETEIYTLAGQEFNINSPKQVGEILYEKLQIPPIKKGKNKFSTSADILEELAQNHKICRKCNFNTR